LINQAAKVSADSEVIMFFEDSLELKIIGASV